MSDFRKNLLQTDFERNSALSCKIAKFYISPSFI